MRNILARLLIGMAITLPLAFTPLAFGADSNFVGTWKLNLKKSKYNPGPPPKSLTVTIESIEDGMKVTSTGENADGTPINGSFTAKYDGKEYPLTGGPADSIAIKEVDANTHTVVTKKGGKVLARGGSKVSGNTMTRTMKGTNAEGKPFNNTTVFDKQ
jgi:hypothetical protein